MPDAAFFFIVIPCFNEEKGISLEIFSVSG
jgi:hypothetical protein